MASNRILRKIGLIFIKIFVINALGINNLLGEFGERAKARQFLDDDLFEDANLTTYQIIRKYGYPVERHYITTKDGYILQMHRIPRYNATPHFLQHGLEDSSAGFIWPGPKKALGYLLYEEGYDVWMGNARGNRYSRRHKTLDPEDKSFWEFSWHEIGVYDLPAMIDYVLNKTGYKKLYYTGHSQGTTAFFVMTSKRPQYNKKILLMQAMAPVAYMTNLKGPLIKMTIENKQALEVLVRLFGWYEYPPKGVQMGAVCDAGPIMEVICHMVLNLLAGPDDAQFNQTLTPVMRGHMPAGSSIRQFIHYAQVIKTGKFAEYDYGAYRNLEKYGSLKPPVYPLSKISAPVVLHYALNDYFIEPIDVDRLYHELGNGYGKYQVATKEFNHVDYMIAMDIRSLLYNKMVQILRDFENGTLKIIVQ